MPRIMLSEAEQEMLRTASLEFGRLYLAQIRPAMDFRSGLVGTRHRLSYGRMAIEVAYIPPAGSKRRPYRPTRDNIITLFDEGIRLGAIEMLTEPGRRELLFRCPLAEVESFASNKDAHRTPMPVAHNDVCGEGAENKWENGNGAGSDAHGGFSEDAQNSGVRGLDVGNSSGSGEDRSTRARSGPTTTSVLPVPVAERAEALCQSLRQFRFVCDPVQFRTIEYREALEQFSDDEILRTAQSVCSRPGLLPGQTFNLSYLLRVLGDLAVSRAAPASHSRRGSAGSGMQRPWFLTATGIEAKAAELGVVLRPGEQWPVFRGRVYVAANLSPDAYRRAVQDFGG